MFETIVALATPPMKSALAVIRLSGDDSFEVVSKCFSKDLRDIKERTALVGNVIDGKNIVDEVVLIAYVAPKSFTGENAVEIICHGSMLIASEIITLLIKNGAKEARRGEFSERAFLHHKIDLIQAESINDLINAQTHEAKSLSLFALDGITSKLITPIKTQLADLISLIEVNIDYPEYTDIEVANKEKIVKEIDKILPVVDSLIEGGEKGKIITNGLKVAIVGKPNVGKSSLLNSLLHEEKAIVTDIAGTTRDIVEGDINLDGLSIHLMDTAGIRDSNDKIEAIGIDKSRKSIENADLVIVLLDAATFDDEDNKIIEYTNDKKRIIVYNKSDLMVSKRNNQIYVSALKDDTDALKKEILKMAGLTKEDFKNPALTNARQVGLIKQVKELLVKAKEDAHNDLTVDLISVSLLAAYHDILEIIGENNDVDISREIFARFCVGK
ncbi:MAG: tRNA uridine-5-carboxymethylaminomethyl(34) synthesis GTPase MnmE [Erysipelotrichaceae bacterium]|nr:tRNA uridine-5-carboxymethylaminomethyl(34) synthesis GTPase MnmE [Erysipelotrichaceae bacterium]